MGNPPHSEPATDSFSIHASIFFSIGNGNLFPTPQNYLGFP